MKCTWTRRAAWTIVTGAVCLTATSTRAADDPPDQGAPLLAITLPSPRVKRPAVLPPLYLSFVALQTYDGYATLRGVGRGAAEANPLMGGLASRPTAFWAVKAASTGAALFAAEQLWRHHHRGNAILTMVAANAAMSAIAARNARILKSP